MSALDSLTAAVTNWQRPAHLDRCLASIRAAGFRRVAIASAEPSEEVLAVIEKHRDGYLSYDVHVVESDCGCNDLWLRAALFSRTKRIVLIHDDDCIAPQFGQVYEALIAPELDRDPKMFASWRASLLFEDGGEKHTEYFHGPTRILPSSEIARVVSTKGRLSLSPIISILDRDVVIRAAKESEQTLLHNDCLYRQGMLLGTEIVAYLRQVRSYPRWLYVDQILSRYGSHEGSGTVAAEQNRAISILAKGYDVARRQCTMPAPSPKPKILFVYFDNVTSDVDELTRNRIARHSWDFHFSQGDMIEVPVRLDQLKRSSGPALGDTRDLPFIKDLFDIGCAMALPEDIVVYCNRDIILSTSADNRIIAGVARGKGATCCQRRRVIPKPGRLYRDFANCKTDGGFDVFAVSPGWWAKNQDKMPDQIAGRECWDTCFRVLVEEHIEGRRQPTVTITDEQWARTSAYTDHVAGHKQHESNWIVERLTSPGNLHNRALGRAFFAERGNTTLVNLLS